MSEELTIDLARRLLAEWGEDISPIQDDWCWCDLARQYPHCRDKAERYFKEQGNGWAVCLMYRYGFSSYEWYESVLKKGQEGNELSKCG